MIALLRYFSHFRLDPETMSDEDFAKAWGQLQYGLEKTGHYGQSS